MIKSNKIKSLKIMEVRNLISFLRFQIGVNVNHE